MYGGAHYVASSTCTTTPQGRAIVAATERWGSGGTLPFTPCKRGYIPVRLMSGGGNKSQDIPTKTTITVAGQQQSPNQRSQHQQQFERLCACSLHHAKRWKRLMKKRTKEKPNSTENTVSNHDEDDGNDALLNFYPGEVNLQFFWSRAEGTTPSNQQKVTPKSLGFCEK